MEWKVVLNEANDLGEGPFWDADTGEIIWVDYTRRHIHFYQVEQSISRILQVKKPCMLAIPTNSGRLIAALDDNLAIVDRLNGNIYTEVCPEPDIPTNRLNDGKCDDRGRLWIGTMDRMATEGKGHLYRIDKDLKAKRMASGFTIPNGMAWNKDGNSFFVVDSARRLIIRYAFDMEKGEITEPEILVETPEYMGLPDGMCIDNQNQLWVAFWTGGCIGVFNSITGQLLKSFTTPCMVPTSCCIGGVNGSSLFVTSSRKYDTPQNIEQFPLAGALFSLNVEVNAPPACLFNDKSI